MIRRVSPVKGRQPGCFARLGKSVALANMCQNLPMRSLSFLPSLAELSRRQRRLIWGALWLAGLLAGLLVLVAQSIESARNGFETDARIAHRLLSQRAVQHEAVLATLSLLQPGVDERLPAVYPQFLQMLRRGADQLWPGTPALAAALSGAEKNQRKPQLAQADLAAGRFWIVMPPPEGVRAGGAAYALEVSLPLMVPWAEWPFGDSPEAATAQATRAWLERATTRWLIHGGSDGGDLRRFVFRKHLAAESQPFDLVAERSYRVADLPWPAMLLWLLAWSAGLAGLAMALRQIQARRRAEELLRLGRVSRLNALGELAAGLAHELNQPLTAVLATTQAAIRMLADEPPELDAARTAMGRTVTQARRAADVVSRLRRVIERPGCGERMALDLAEIARGVVQLLEPECRKRAVAIRVEAGEALMALGDPVAIEQIIHNLLVNALAALENSAGRQRTLRLRVSPGDSPSIVRLSVRDNGPGVPPELLERLFEPFVSGRRGGLGLGLSLCQTLAEEMGGRLSHRPMTPGAEFSLDLPAAIKGAPGPLA
jgi:signal transduction histidine kinase